MEITILATARQLAQLLNLEMPGTNFVRLSAQEGYLETLGISFASLLAQEEPLVTQQLKHVMLHVLEEPGRTEEPVFVSHAPHLVQLVTPLLHHVQLVTYQPII